MSLVGLGYEVAKLGGGLAFVVKPESVGIIVTD